MKAIKEEGRREYKEEREVEGTEEGKREKRLRYSGEEWVWDCSTSIPPFLCGQHLHCGPVRAHGNTYLHGVRGTELHFSEVPGRIPRAVGFPDLLIKAGHIPRIQGEDIVIPLLELVIKRQAARHGGCGHGGDELCHLLEVLDVNRVHVHVMAWRPQRRENTASDGLGFSDEMVGFWDSLKIIQWEWWRGSEWVTDERSLAMGWWRVHLGDKYMEFTVLC